MSEAFDYWDFFRRECERAGDVPLYLDIVTGIGGDDDLKALASHVKRGQPMANVLLAAVHYLLLRGAQHPLRAHYPNLNNGVRREGPAFPLFKDFVNQHREEVDALIRKGVTNTNEVARCSTLNAGFRAVAKEAGDTLALIEIGPSAGLNMFWDSYRVRYSKDGQTHTVGPDNAPLTIDCALQGDVMPPLGPAPTIASRVGLELNPVDLGDPYWRDWLKALVWPDQIARFERLESAIEFVRGKAQDIRPGSALDTLADAIAEVPPEIPVCVYHTYVTYQFSDEMRDALDAILTTASLRRPIWRLSAEGSLASPGDAPLTLRHYRDGVRTRRQLALAHPHGKWLQWMDA